MLSLRNKQTKMGNTLSGLSLLPQIISFLESLLYPAIEASTFFVHLNVFLQSDILTFTQIAVARLWHRFCFWLLVFPIPLPSWRFCSYVVGHCHCDQCPNRTAYKECFGHSFRMTHVHHGGEDVVPILLSTKEGIWTRDFSCHGSVESRESRQ